MVTAAALGVNDAGTVLVDSRAAGCPGRDRRRSLAARPLGGAESRLSQAKRNFHRQRERLEAKFIQLASTQAKPDSPRWADCEFDDAVAYVRHRSTGELSAFVAVTVALQGVHDAAAVSTADLIGNLRAGTAVFRFDRDHWETDGRAILNLSPSEAIRFYQDNLEVVAQELTSHL